MPYRVYSHSECENNDRYKSVLIDYVVGTALSVIRGSMVRFNCFFDACFLWKLRNSWFFCVMGFTLARALMSLI